ncbi:HAMP domain-containing sensor histidine kinase [Variovorax sp. KK3]|uniref:sensor histidine kinase n=1 Tax=Variovorax sp. KK3 TaxID=1855728 RepID=UPI00117DD244|nr:HAMP domain-containing sensor histidine kinase [Variovorax sp. KK3]
MKKKTELKEESKHWLQRRYLIEWILMLLLLPSAMVWLDRQPGLLEANAAIAERMLSGRANDTQAHTTPGWDAERANLDPAGHSDPAGHADHAGHAVELSTGMLRVLWISLPVWAALLLFLINGSHSVAWTLAATAVCSGISYAVVKQFGVALPLASPLCGIVAAYVLWSWRRMNALLLFFRERAERLNAVPAGAFEPPLSARPPTLDSVARRTNMLDLAIERLTRLQALLTQGMWMLPVPVLICRDNGVVSQSNAAAQTLLAPIPSAPGDTQPSQPDSGTDRLQGANLPELIAGLRKTEIEPAHLAQARPRTIWDRALGHEFTTEQGSIFTLRAVSLDASEAAGTSSRAWVVVLNDITTERRAQREREQWFSFLSHDVRSPQVSILSMLALHLDGGSDGDLKLMFDGIGREARRTINLTESFMDMLEAETQVYSFQSTVAGAVVLDAIDSIWSAAKARKVTVVPRLGTAERSLWADPSLITRGLSNLLSNAIRHSPVGGTIYICVESNPDTDSPHGEMLISVQDEGSGMDAAKLDKLMAVEEQKTDGVRRANGGANPEAGHGWGVGMAIVRTVIARHGGWLDIMSAEMAGTTFLIGLPLGPDDAALDAD